MTLVIPDDILQKAGLTERDALIEFACRLFQSGRLHLWPAARMAGLSRTEMEEALMDRGIPVYIVTEEDLQRDMETIASLRDNL